MARFKFFSMLILATILLILLCSSTTTATLADDEKDCADQLQNLAECIPYVSGTANKPTPQCCADADKVRTSNPKCLCVLILESTDTSLALPINTTLALQMPAACNSDAKISDCPSNSDILKLSAYSPEAKIFKDSGRDTSKATTAASSTSTAAGSTSGASASTPASAEGSSSKVAPANNNAGRLETLTVVVLMVSLAVIFM